MLNIRYTTKFKKDLKLCSKRNYQMNLLQQIINILVIPEQLPQQNKDHALTGNFNGYRECHIMPDWLLIYQQTEDELVVHRTGTHADLFGM